MNLTRNFTPPPMPDIRPARIPLADLDEAVRRALAAWNRAQLEDALRSARTFLDAAEDALRATSR